MSQIKVGSGNLVWRHEEKLYSWNGKKLSEINLDEHQTVIGYSLNGEKPNPDFDKKYLDDFLISPDGAKIVWNVNVITAITSKNSGTSLTKHIVYSASIDGQNKRIVHEKSFKVPGFFAESRESIDLKFWSKKDLNRIFLCEHDEEQLTASFRGLFALNLLTGQMSTISSDVETILEISNDETKLLETPNDETCCAGTNYTNNTVNIVDIKTGKRREIYNEWKEFNNPPVDAEEEGGLEFMPGNASFSPSLKWIGISISGDKQIATIRDANTGKPIISVDESHFLGWFTDEKILLGRGFTEGLDTPNIREMSVYDLKSGDEKPLPPQNFVFIAVKPHP
ncbi:hypothetical protein HYR99_05330 [Candidatus Poribacteria bacterium]|nr:hypothetical protein [Candidatus Poribacteria bacterium]